MSESATLLMGLLVGVLGSIIASLIFLRTIVIKFKPKVVISAYIAQEPPDENGITWYWFKIINQSRYDGFDLKFRIEELEMEPCENGCFHTTYDEIPLAKDSFAFLPRFKSDAIVAKEKSAAHCFQVRTQTDLRAILSQKRKSIRIQVTLKHGLSGLSDVFYGHFGNDSVVKNGSFKFGNQLDIA